MGTEREQPTGVIGMTKIHLLEQNQVKINWHYLSLNSNAIHLLEQNPAKINWDMLSKNPSIFKYDYIAIKQRITAGGMSILMC